MKVHLFSFLFRDFPLQVSQDSTHVEAHCCAGAGKGASEQAIGITKGGRNSKLHALVDKLCRPWVIILTPGNVADCTVGARVCELDGWRQKAAWRQGL